MHFFNKNNPLRKWFIISLFIHIIVAIFSDGFHHPDEHFQLLEPAGFKNLLYGGNDLSWEFTDKIRPGIQILFTSFFIKICYLFQITSPFTMVLFLRIITTVFCWYLSWEFYFLFRKYLRNILQKKLLLWMTIFCWFIPYLHARYSSENIAMLLFFGGLLFFLKEKSNIPIEKKKSYLYIFLCGLLMGISFYVRFQIAFAILGFLLYILFKSLKKLKYFSLLAGGGILGAFLGTLSDYWFYNEWVFTPVHYFTSNIIDNKAASWGSSPFYSYFLMFIESTAPPFSILLLVLILAGIWRLRNTIFSFIILPFLLAHFMVGHKELRFLFPMVLLIPLFTAAGIVYFKNFYFKYKTDILFKIIFRLGVFINYSLLLATFVKPASETISVFKKLNTSFENNVLTTKNLYASQEPFETAGLQMNFYNPKNWGFQKIESTDTIEINTKQKLIYIYTEKYQKPIVKNGVVELYYSNIHDFLFYFNYGNWVERSNVKCIWKVELEN